MSITLANNLTVEGRKTYRPRVEPNALNPIYKRELHSITCPFCVSKPGRKKHFVNLWSLYQHCSFNHKKENYKKIVTSLAELILEGVLI